ncbi:TIGR03016 family PEP-CTERM system-associated outer membrane protein [Aestuariibacter salexigens]|uniref:TIGR03016 family PEP-CTERM system-associated outer membrane protein n=1 Tax=Aestuariibacter salexigens TaxID=226010 RepID=UPI00040E788B|nr:TIGR03016 family PEP-CTERM system-associated outer membrane protein [Aestuariibacter salexigens]
MVTTTHNAKRKTNCWLSPVLSKNSKYGALFGVLISSNLSNAQELSVNADISTSLINQGIETADPNRPDDINTLSVKPRLSGEYRTRTFQGRWAGTYTFLDRELDENSRTDNFAEYLYSASWSPVDNLLTITASGAMNYQNVNTDGYLVNDFLLNSEDLSKTRSNRIAASTSVPNGKLLRAFGQVSYAFTDSERSERQNTQNLDNDTISAQGSLQNGTDAEHFFWNVNSSFSATERGGAQSDFISRSVSANIDIPLYQNLAFTVVGSHEGNQFGNQTGRASAAREFNSAGVGLSYRPSNERRIALTINTSESELEENDGDTFIGVDINWAFTTRTSFSANYGRRFYGDSAGVEFSYNAKQVRARLSYSEDVTSFSRLISNPENLGVFVCADGIVALSACFQPNTLDYQLDANEQFVQFSSQNVELNNEVLLRKSLNGQLGYSKRTFSISLDGRYALDESLEQERQRRLYSVGLTAGIRLGRVTSINSNISYANTEQRSELQPSGDSDTWNASITLSREFGKRLSVKGSLKYVDRSGTLNTGFGGTDITDRRISIGLTYRFLD